MVNCSFIKTVLCIHLYIYVYRSISSPASIYGPTEVRPEGLGNIMHLIPMPAGYTSYSLREGRGGVFHVRASAIGPSARHNTRPPLYKVLIWREFFCVAFGALHICPADLIQWPNIQIKWIPTCVGQFWLQKMTSNPKQISWQTSAKVFELCPLL